jgi:hypothetical protein
MITKKDVAAEYRLDRKGHVKNPGKFEGEHWSTVALWDEVGEGNANECYEWGEDAIEDVFIADEELRRAFKLPADIHAVSVFSNGQGFVTQTRYTEKELNRLDRAYTAHCDETRDWKGD